MLDFVRDDDPAVRRAAVTAAARWSFNDVRPALTLLLGSPSEEDRMAGLKALRSLWREDDFPGTLAISLEDAADGVRREAARLLLLCAVERH